MFCFSLWDWDWDWDYRSCDALCCGGRWGREEFHTGIPAAWRVVSWVLEKMIWLDSFAVVKRLATRVDRFSGRPRSILDGFSRFEVREEP